jgi:hypothetical protein
MESLAILGYNTTIEVETTPAPPTGSSSAKSPT